MQLNAAEIVLSRFRRNPSCCRYFSKDPAVNRILKQERKQAVRESRLAAQKAKLEREEAKAKAKQYTCATPVGEKKDISGHVPDAYDPQYVEAAWNSWWQQSRIFTPEHAKTDKGKFVVCLPPPNVTGTLHLGHALGCSIQDAIVRWQRMKGNTVLWLPGSDHAGIATQVVVEKKLWQERKLNRHQLGRERFVDEVWQWTREKGGHIFEQMKRLGCSLDFTRNCFTLDEKLSKAVNEAFIRLHRENLIYRSPRMVNWSCALQSAISDVEVEEVELTGPTDLHIPGYKAKVTFGQLIKFAYPLSDSGDERLVVATTRPETMFGDVAVAVNPSDSRYASYIGRRVVHPFTSHQLPVIADSSVDVSLGTGVLKVTPGHDNADHDLGIRHNLPTIDILSDDGRLMNVPKEFNGLPRFEARAKVLKFLADRGLLVEICPHAMRLPMCSRSKDIIEPRLKDQWFVNVQDMARQAREVVENGQLKLIPDTYNKLWSDWLNKAGDWCISRQIWWGHRIPAYRVLHNNKPVKTKEGQTMWVSAHNAQEALQVAQQTLRQSSSDSVETHQLSVVQDEDVLDTWFSSALFPFSVFGWPHQSADLSQFYPTSLIETASDILFFWVTRMVMMGLKLTGQLPFTEVLFHGILRDAHGRKMSKSLGNVVDPLHVVNGISLQELKTQLELGNLDKSEVHKAKEGLERDFPLGIQQCGADALRFTLCSYHFKAHFINVDITHVVSSRHFCNKIWQAFRFITTRLGTDFKPLPYDKVPGTTSPTEDWLLSRLTSTVSQCDSAFATYDLFIATKALHTFFWADFCDVYLEYCKHALQSAERRDTVCHVLYHTLHVFLRLASPFMPFLTEELYQRLPRRPDADCPSVCVAAYPTPAQFAMWHNENVDREMEFVRNVVKCVQVVRVEEGLPKHQPINVEVVCQSADKANAVTKHMTVVTALSRAASVTSSVTDSQRNSSTASNGLLASVSVENDCIVIVSRVP